MYFIIQKMSDYSDEFESDSDDIPYSDIKCSSCREYLTEQRKKKIDSDFCQIKYSILDFVRTQLNELDHRSKIEKRHLKLDKTDNEVIDTVKGFISNVLHLKYVCKICEIGPKNATRAREILGEHFIEKYPIPSYYSYYKKEDWLGKWGLEDARLVKRDTLSDLHAFL